MAALEVSSFLWGVVFGWFILGLLLLFVYFVARWGGGGD